MNTVFPNQGSIESVLVQVAVMQYELELKNYEAARILGDKVDASILEPAKLRIADELLKGLEISTPESEKRIQEWQEKLAREGESPSAPRPSIPAWLRWKVFRRDGYKCVNCKLWWDLTVDHIVPVSKGGATVIENLQTLCRVCNSRKGAT